MFLKVYSPHILVYKPQVNSIFSLFLRFILLIAFVDFLFFSFHFSFLVDFLYNYFLDINYVTEAIIIFYILSVLGEDLIDYDIEDLEYLDIDLVTFFRFFSNFSLLLVGLSVSFLLFGGFFWSSLIMI